MKKNSVFIILGILAGLNLLAWLAVLELSQTQYLEVTFFDVGQGDAILTEWTQYIPSYLGLSSLLKTKQYLYKVRRDSLLEPSRTPGLSC